MTGACNVWKENNVGPKLRYAPFPPSVVLDVAKAKEVVGAWVTDYVIAIKGKIEKPRTSKRYGIVRERSFDMGSADSRQDDPRSRRLPVHGTWWSVVDSTHETRQTRHDSRRVHTHR